MAYGQDEMAAQIAARHQQLAAQLGSNFGQQQLSNFFAQPLSAQLPLIGAAGQYFAPPPFGETPLEPPTYRDELRQETDEWLKDALA